MADLHDTVTALCGQITEDMANQKVVVAGVITYVRRLTTKKGDPMAFAGLEDLQGTTEVVIFPRTWKQVEPIMPAGQDRGGARQGGRFRQAGQDHCRLDHGSTHDHAGRRWTSTERASIGARATAHSSHSRTQPGMGRRA